VIGGGQTFMAKGAFPGYDPQPMPVNSTFSNNTFA